MQQSSLLARLTLLLLAVAMTAWACSSGSGSPDDDNVPVNESDPVPEAFNGAHTAMQADMQRAAAVLSGPGGLQETSEALAALDLTTEAGRQSWGTLTARYEQQLFELERTLAAAALSAIEMADHEAAMQQMRIDALAEPVTEFGPQPKLISLATVFVVTTTAITLTRVYRNIRDYSHNNQNIPVRRVATTSESGRQVIVNALERRGVDVPAGATGEEVAELFEDQNDRYLRAHVTQVARDFNISEAGGTGPTAVAAADNLEAQRQQNAQAARDGGVIAVDSVVNLSTAGPTGLGTAGETTMLVLTATEYTPNDIVNRHVDAVVASRDSQPLVTTPPTVDPAEARQRLREASTDDADPPTPEEADAFAEAIVAALREQAERFGPLTSLPMRIAFGSTTLAPVAGQPGSYEASVQVPGFTEGDSAELLISREGALPQEEASHPLGPNTPVEIEHTPLLGTISVAISQIASGAEESEWSAEVTLRGVHNPTSLVFDGVNVVAQPRVVAVAGAGTYSTTVTAFGRGTLRVRRLDSGETYLTALTADDPTDDCGGIGTFACGDGTIICADLVCNTQLDCNDGSDEDASICGSQDSCCVATQGCPSETGSSCGETCCCCPYGQICHPTDWALGCVPE